MLPSLIPIFLASLAFAQADPSSTGAAVSPTCTPASGTPNDTPAIEQAVQNCPNGSIYIPTGKTYNIGSLLDFKGCIGYTLAIDGTLQVTPNLTYWDGITEAILVSKINGMTIHSPSGSGVIDGNGQVFWDHIATNSEYVRPRLLRINETTNLDMHDISIRNAPAAHIVTEGWSSNVSFRNITMHSVSTSANVAGNTDGFDLGAVSYISLENIHITNGDDCVALKNESDHVAVRDVTCVGSHGLSLGSLASEHGTRGYVVDSIFERAVMINATKATGIKIFAAGPDHGSASVRNITFKDIVSQGCHYALQIQTCYDATAEYCEEYPSTATLSDVVWSNITGTTSGHYGDVIGNLDCSVGGTCGISVSGLNVTAPDGGVTLLCANVDGDIGYPCTEGASG
ncbi:hypothetical protein BDW74DRAFT_168381 [Aspergillus multicolor]|uniref:uncharacterized protein n=1 Tax=Aspergillus multicolor TaxID=41759 RepID=UPI003CCD4352